MTTGRSAAGSRRLGAWAAKRLAYHSGVLALARRARRTDRAMVLRYHAVTPSGTVDYAAPEICMPIEAFRLQMAFVRRAYRVVSMDELADALGRGRRLPPGAVAVTFDDGYADNHTLAAPVLRQLGLCATVYVATGSIDDRHPFWVSAVRVLAMRAPDQLSVPGLAPLPVGDPPARERAARAVAGALVSVGADERWRRIAATAASMGVDLERALQGTMLTTAQIHDLAAQGWTIGAHTVMHSNLVEIGPEEARREIRDSRDVLAAMLGSPVRHFCYPNTGGRHAYFDEATARILESEGFRSAVTSQPGAIRATSDAFRLPRLGVSPRLTEVIELATALERQRLVA